MKLQCELVREVLEHYGEKAVRKTETMQATIEYDGDGNVLNSQHPNRLYGEWRVLRVEGPK